MFVDYYSDLFKSSISLNLEDIMSAIQPKVSEAMNASLIKEFKAEEVHKA